MLDTPHLTKCGAWGVFYLRRDPSAPTRLVRRMDGPMNPLHIEEIRSEFYYSPRQLAELLSVSVRTLEGWRLRGCGPEYSAISSRMIRYSGASVLAWLAAFEAGSDLAENTTG